MVEVRLLYYPYLVIRMGLKCAFYNGDIPLKGSKLIDIKSSYVRETTQASAKTGYRPMCHAGPAKPKNLHELHRTSYVRWHTDWADAGVPCGERPGMVFYSCCLMRSGREAGCYINTEQK